MCPPSGLRQSRKRMPPPTKPAKKSPKKKATRKTLPGTTQIHAGGKSETDQSPTGPEKDRNQGNDDANRTNDNATKNAA